MINTVYVIAGPTATGKSDLSISLANKVIFPLSKKVTGFIDIGYNRLIGDAGDSQIVKRQGSSNQFSLMFNAMYEFYTF